MLGTFDSGKRRSGLQRNALHRRIQFFEAAGGADERAARAQHRDEVRNPPLRLLRKVIPSINLGGMRIDIAFLVLMVITSVLMNIRIA